MTSSFSEKKFDDFIKIFRLIWEDIVRNNSRNTIKQKEILFSYVSDHYIRILNNYKLCLKQKIELCAQSMELMRRISEEYLDLFEKIPSKIETMNLSDLSRVIYIFHHMKCWNLIQSSEYSFQIEKITELQKVLYTGILLKCHFNQEEKKIGIYGTGKHTEGLLSVYEKLIGEVESELIFIDTRRDNETYKNRNVINYRKI